ncbi:MAG: phosphotransferase [Kiritimatiellaeota bacterium]|nr:phosphotransferase [Kiritimatiellota bacterium]
MSKHKKNKPAPPAGKDANGRRFATPLEEALSFYNLPAPEAVLIRHSENMTYKVVAGGGTFLLRLHKPVEGLHFVGAPGAAMLRARVECELALLTALNANGAVPVQRPVASARGSIMASLADGTPVSMLGWIEGETLDKVEATPAVLGAAGFMLAKLHRFLRSYHKTMPGFDYSQAMFPEIARQMGLAVEGGAITRLQGRMVWAALGEAHRRMDQLDLENKKLIVHADLNKSNLLLGADGVIVPIDFGLCGTSHFHMDLGSLCGAFATDAERLALLKAYERESGRKANPREIEPYLALQVLLFVAGQWRRAKDWEWFGAAMDRWCRDIFVPLAKRVDFLFQQARG